MKINPNVQGLGTQDTNTHAVAHDDSDVRVPRFILLLLVVQRRSNYQDYAEELARLQGQAYEANSAAKDTWKTADTVPAGSGVPATSIPAGSINQAAGGSAVPSTPSSSIIGDITSPVLTRGTLKKSKFLKSALAANS
ncbi:hypothetical protein Tco_0410428 [Tanacetum coccineum]